MKPNSLALLIQTALRAGQMDCSVFIQGEDGSLHEIVVSHGTDYPAQVILKMGAVAHVRRRS